MLSVENLAYHYKGRPAVLKDVNFNVNTGEFLAILGNNGVGKSTMLKCFNKILTPDGGKIILDDENLLQMNARQVAQRVAFVAQNVPSTQMTVHDMVMLGRRPYMKWGFTEDDHQIVHHAMAELQIEPLRGRFLNELSGGERQRVWLSLSLAQEPNILLLDEPTTYLDSRHQIELMELVKRTQRERNIMVVMVLHDLNLALRYSDRIIALKEGAIVGDGAPHMMMTPENLANWFGIKADILQSPRSEETCPICVPYGLA